MKKNKKLVFSFLKAAPYGYIAEPYIMNFLPDGSFSYDFEKVIAKQLNNHQYPFSEEEIQCIKLCEEMYVPQVEKLFRKEKVKIIQFWQNFENDEVLRRTLMHHINLKMSTLLKSLKGSKIFIRGKASDHPAAIAAQVENEAAEVVYNFHKNEEGLQYFLSIQFAQKKLLLNSFANASIICNNPCFLLIGNQVLHLNDETEGSKLIPFFTKSAIEVKPAMASKYIESFVLPAFKKYKVEYEGFSIQKPDKQIKAEIDFTNNLEGVLGLKLSFKYGKKTFNPGNTFQKTLQSAGTINPFELIEFSRDEFQENALIETLISENLTHDQQGYFYLKDKVNPTIADYLPILSKLSVSGFFLIYPNWKGLQYEINPPALDFKINQEDDWFDVHATVVIGAYTLRFLQLKDNILSNNPYFKLPDGKIFVIPQEWMKKAYDLFLFSESDETIRIGKHHQSILENNPLFGTDIKPHLSKDEKQIYLAAEPIDYQLPKTLNATLRPYQQYGYNWIMHLANSKLGACLADDMGLGKTLQVIAVLLKHYENTNKKAQKPASFQLNLFDQPVEYTSLDVRFPSLIVLSPSLIHNWAAELVKFAPDLKFSIYTAQSKTRSFDDHLNSQIILTTYGVVRNDITLLSSYTFEFVVLDESQLIKNARSLSFQAVKKLHAKYRVVLTGTPVENSLTDLWSQLTFLNPGLLGAYRFFKQEFVNPIEKQGNQEVLMKLKKIINPFILRRTKDEVAKDLPPLTERILYCEMESDQKKLYEEVKSFYRNQIIESIAKVGIEKSQITILKGLTELRLIANHPKMRSKDLKSGKFEEVIKRLGLLIQDQRKVIVFSQFVKHLELFKAHLQEAQISYNWLTGTVKNRKEEIEDFTQKKNACVFLISLKTGGVGLNLTASENVFILDPWWNPAVEEQAIARAHRIGQTNNVFSYKFITKESIEEKILALQQNKSSLAREVINNNPISSLSELEIQQLFD